MFPPLKWLAAPCLLLLLTATDVRAQAYCWNPANATGDWDTTTPIWGLTTFGPFNTTFANGGTPVLNAAPAGTTATVTTSISTASILFSGSFTVVASGGGSLTVADNAYLVGNGSGSDFLQINTPILGATTLGFANAGAGIAGIFLNADNTFSNGIAVLDNTRVSVGNAGLSAGPVQSGTLAGDVTLQTTTSIVSFETTQSYTGVVAGIGDLEVTSPAAGATTLTLSAPQTLTGSVRVLDGSTLALANDGATTFGSITDATLISLSRNATLDVTGHTSGTWTLASAQTLQVSGTTVSNGGRILGPARIEGTLDLTGEAVTRTGTLRQEGGNLTIAGGATWRTNITTWTGTTPGADFSHVSGVGGAKLDLSDASAGNPIRLDVRGESLTGFDSAVASSWVIADFSAGNVTDGIVAFAADKFLIDTAAFGQALNGGFFTVSTDANNNQLTLSFTPVPEPSVVLGIAAMGISVGGLVRRRLRRPVD